MRSLLAAAMTLGLALAGPAAAQTGNRSFDATYTVHARGVEAGDFDFSFRQTGATYTATANREMKGWVGAALRRSSAAPR